MRLIDADALKEYIDAQKGRPFIGCTIGEALKMMVDEQPTIERKTGKWSIIPAPSEGYCGYIKCPFCGTGYIEDDYNFCPNCGADMRGGQDG